MHFNWMIEKAPWLMKIKCWGLKFDFEIDRIEKQAKKKRICRIKDVRLRWKFNMQSCRGEQEAEHGLWK